MINFSEEQRGYPREVGRCVVATILLCIGILVAARLSSEVRMWRVCANLDINPSWRSLDTYFNQVFALGNTKEHVFEAVSKVQPQSLSNEPTPGIMKGQDVDCYRLSFRKALGNRRNDRVFCFDKQGRLVTVDLVMEFY